MQRIKRFICLDDDSENESESIFNHLLEYKDNIPLNTLYSLRLIGDIIQSNRIIKEYVINNNHVTIIPKLLI